MYRPLICLLELQLCPLASRLDHARNLAGARAEDPVCELQLEISRLYSCLNCEYNKAGHLKNQGYPASKRSWWYLILACLLELGLLRWLNGGFRQNLTVLPLFHGQISSC